MWRVSLILVISNFPIIPSKMWFKFFLAWKIKFLGAIRLKIDLSSFVLRIFWNPIPIFPFSSKNLKKLHISVPERDHQNPPQNSNKQPITFITKPTKELRKLRKQVLNCCKTIFYKTFINFISKQGEQLIAQCSLIIASNNKTKFLVQIIVLSCSIIDFHSILLLQGCKWTSIIRFCKSVQFPFTVFVIWFRIKL